MPFCNCEFCQELSYLNYRRNPVSNVSKILESWLYKFNPLIGDPTAAVELEKIASGEFIIDEEDLRETRTVTRKIRKGQERFRKMLMQIHGPKGMITGSSAPGVIEAAHIKPYRGPKDNHHQNGLLLRVDLHRLFDRDLIGFDPKTLKLHIHPVLKDTDWAQWDGIKLNVDKNLISIPALQIRWKDFLDAKTQSYRRNDSLACKNEIIPLDSGIEIKTYKGNCYRILVTEKQEEYRHKQLVSGCYQYIIPEYFLESQQHMFRVFRLLFMGDECIIPMISSKFKQLKRPLLTGPQQEAVFYGNEFSSGFFNSYYDGHKAGLLTLPTGMGKTICAAVIYHYLSTVVDGQIKLRKVLFLSHQIEHLINAESKFVQLTPQLMGKTGFLFSKTGKSNVDKKIFKNKQEASTAMGVFSTRASMAKKYKYFKRDHFDFIVVDEAHGVRTPEYTKILKYFKPKEYLLGLTATPFRTDKKNVISAFTTTGFSEEQEYSRGDGNIVYRMENAVGADLARAIIEGYLSRVTYKLINDVTQYENYIKKKPIVIKNGKKRLIKKKWTELVKEVKKTKKAEVALEAYLNIAEELGHQPKTVAFCEGINDAYKLSKYFRANGINAMPYVSSKPQTFDENTIPDQKNTTILNQFKYGDIDILFTKNMFNEGIDVPQIEVVMFLEHSQSSVMQLQRLGRGLRLAPNKRSVVVLDFESNYNDLYDLINKGVVKQFEKTLKGKTGTAKNSPKKMDGSLVGFDADVEIETLEELKELIDVAQWNAHREIPYAFVERARELRSGGFGYEEIEKALRQFALELNVKPLSYYQFQTLFSKYVIDVVISTDEGKQRIIDEILRTARGDFAPTKKGAPSGVPPLNYISWEAQLDDIGVQEFLTNKQYQEAKRKLWDWDTAENLSGEDPLDKAVVKKQKSRNKRQSPRRYC